MSHAVVFDLDDTLAVTDRDRETLLSVAADRAGIALSFDRSAYREAHREHSGTESRRPVFEALVGEDAPALTRAYREAIGEALRPVDGAERLVATLRERYRVGLLTDGPGRTQRDKLERLGWTDAFDAVLITGAIGAPKPDGEGFARIAAELGVDPGRAAYVGDDPKRDIAGAAGAGFAPVQVRYPGGPAAHPAAEATVPRDDIGRLPGLLGAVFEDGLEDA
ncbi:HAD family hydrolase [Natronomonas sp.]|uniref:HAD family hydrolase n=1 Tax=Natronomonas sp. TaxID=2184060 RepID=UPI00260B1D1A|nr:HAD family hydrolase [Natronomonas sp.]